MELLQGKRRCEDGVFPDDRPAFLPLAAGDDHSGPLMMENEGTELQIGDKCVGQLSRARSNSEETLCVLIGTDSSQQRFTCSVELDDESAPAKRRSFSLRLVERPLVFQREHREELDNFQRAKRP